MKHLRSQKELLLEKYDQGEISTEELLKEWDMSLKSGSNRKMLIIVLFFCSIYFAWLFRWQIVPVSAGSGGSEGFSGDTALGAYRIDRWTGNVMFYSRFRGAAIRVE